MKLKIWTIALMILIIADSIFTVYIGFETNDLILWIMNTLNINLKQAMILRIFALIPLIVIINHWNYSRLTFFSYVCVYVTLAGIQHIPGYIPV